MADRVPRPSADEETAPLLHDPDADSPQNGHGEHEAGHRSFTERVNSIAQEPLTPLTKVLLVVCLIFLLLSSIFIGLFAGAQHKLNSGFGGQPGDTVTLTATTTAYTTTTAAPSPGPTQPPSEPPCLDADCIVLSAAILSSLDTTHDPCEAFFDFSNGGWLKQHPIPADKGSVSQFGELAKQNQQVLREILEEKTTIASTDYDGQLLGKIRGMYNSCLNEDKLDAIGMEPLLHFVHTIRHLLHEESTGITAQEKTKVSAKGLTAAIAFMHSRGLDALFSFNIEGDVGVDNTLSLWFNQPPLGLPAKEYFEDEDIRHLYQDTIERLLVTVADEGSKLRSKVADSLEATIVNQAESVWPPWPWPPWGGDDDDDKPENQTERAHRLAKAAVKFEREIAKASQDLDVLQEDPIASYNPVPLDNLTATLTQIKFTEYFSTFAPRNFPSKIIVTYPPYAQSLADLLEKTDSEVIEAYLVAHAALSLSPYLGLSTEAWKTQRALVEELSGIKKGVVGDRSEHCIGQVEQTLGFAAGRYFVNATFGGESRDKGTKVITDIVEAFKASLKDIQWMDEKSAKAAAEKADALRVKVGFPISPDTRDAASLVRYYGLVTINEDTFFENILSAQRSERIKEWLSLGRKRDPEAWEMWPSMVNAYFNPPANEIVFPAGILQAPFFSKDWPGYLSYGAFGQVAAHELTHAFDSAGRLYNQEGLLKSWWTNETSAGFQKKQDCIVKQYSNYTIDDGKGGQLHLNGNLTSGENIGDTGLIQAYRAWKSQYNTSFDEGTEYILPGVPYTRDQLFFISFGRIWGRSMKTAAAVQQVLTDPHSPARFRVDGTVSNIPEFAEAFKCPKGAKLNPPVEEQCRFW
ncbi:zincin [Cylindrobasidium torrendii FP15055 ss-10]|uniref:Zincin n=1 Tax=Cylindrobasidium torrendii FP15055 ss-10 TaxID=1314674 RepID=A0A0D7BV66_9AGAR|nr:zincin [Cylindrobasidium torrendii FP15055 ss-10]